MYVSGQAYPHKPTTHSPTNQAAVLKQSFPHVKDELLKVILQSKSDSTLNSYCVTKPFEAMQKNS